MKLPVTETGLIIHRFNAVGLAEPMVRRSVSEIHAARLYQVEDASLNRLAWYETTRFVSEDETTSWTVGAHEGERMSFHLRRDVGNVAAASIGLPWLYVVHTDVPDDVAAEYNAWYDEEHLPRLVRVPGIIRARRYASPDRHPRYLTAYELSDRDAFVSPEGLKARQTPWTERMRALFTNTRQFTGQLL